MYLWYSAEYFILSFMFGHVLLEGREFGEFIYVFYIKCLCLNRFLLHKNYLSASTKGAKMKIWDVSSWLKGKRSDNIIRFETKASQFITHLLWDSNHKFKYVIGVNIGDGFHILFFEREISFYGAICSDMDS